MNSKEKPLSSKEKNSTATDKSRIDGEETQKKEIKKTDRREKILNYLKKREDSFFYRILFKYYEFISYVVFGVLTFVVNITVYGVLEGLLGQSKWFLSNFPAIFLAILFAYITNRIYVFGSKGNFWLEMIKFFAARIVISLIFEYGTIYLLYNVLGFDKELNLFFFSISWFKIPALVLVIIGNYFASKIFVFSGNSKSKKSKPENDEGNIKGDDGISEESGASVENGISEEGGTSVENGAFEE